MGKIQVSHANNPSPKKQVVGLLTRLEAIKKSKFGKIFKERINLDEQMLNKTGSTLFSSPELSLYVADKLLKDVELDIVLMEAVVDTGQKIEKFTKMKDKFPSN
ncbi:MAG: hypothetical protein ABIH83_01830 [Candidatus Micrarchaeota archaeon]